VRTVALFQIICFSVLFIAYIVMIRLRPETVILAPVIFIAAWIGEATSIWFYGFYDYPDHWWLRLGGVPLMVPMIWPLVILTGREVIRSFWPNKAWLEPWLVGFIVFLDASMVEVCAVSSGLWYWTEPGYIGVPLIGVLGWAYFAAIVAWLLSRLEGRALPLLILLAPALLHLVLIATWWGLFKWVLRGDWFGLFGITILAATTAVLRARSARRMAMPIALVRLLAAGVFVGLLAFAAPTAWRVWLHVILLAIVYLLAMDFRISEVQIRREPQQ
jgi:hypothetical protein